MTIGDYTTHRYVMKHHTRHRRDYESEADEAINTFFKYVALFMAIAFIFWSIWNVIVPLVNAVAGLVMGSKE